MAAKKSAAPPGIFQIKVSLLDIRPPIWRRLLVPSDMTLKRFHDVLQVAMGWQDCHLHEFVVGRNRFGIPDPSERGMGIPETRDERTARLSEVFGRAGAKGRYTYDFGDGWEHEITLEKLLPPEPAGSYPVCTAGARHCPPEDCGGVPGYYNFLEAIRDPRHEEHDELLDWAGGAFDPKAFSVDDVNRELAAFRRRKARMR